VKLEFVASEIRLARGKRSVMPKVGMPTQEREEVDLSVHVRQFSSLHVGLHQDHRRSVDQLAMTSLVLHSALLDGLSCSKLHCKGYGCY
jgi:hypothetical protein